MFIFKVRFAGWASAVGVPASLAVRRSARARTCVIWCIQLLVCGADCADAVEVHRTGLVRVVLLK